MKHVSLITRERMAEAGLALVVEVFAWTHPVVADAVVALVIGQAVPTYDRRLLEPVRHAEPDFIAGARQQRRIQESPARPGLRCLRAWPQTFYVSDVSSAVSSITRRFRNRGAAEAARSQRALYELARLGKDSEGWALRLFGNEQRDGTAGSRLQCRDYIERDIEDARSDCAGRESVTHAATIMRQVDIRSLTVIFRLGNISIMRVLLYGGGLVDRIANRHGERMQALHGQDEHQQQ